MCTLLAIQQNSSIFFFSSMLLIPVTIENMRFAVLTQLPCCIVQSESVLNGVISLWVKKCQFQIMFFPPRPVLSQTHAVTEVQSLLTSSANRVSYVESGHQELCCLKHLSSYFLPHHSNRCTERAGANHSVLREILHFNPKLTETIPLQHKFRFFLTRHCS